MFTVYLLKSYRPALKVNETELERITTIAEATNPGGIIAMNPNLYPYFQRGGKVLEYHGLADGFIP
jgi:hypothetical protein